MAQITIDSERCKGCSLCIGACPKSILAIDARQINRKGHSPATAKDESRCSGCGFCALMCPDCAITVER
jgi:2-oxoglutarate ferredoxin oxidoreductase subunit delta